MTQDNRNKESETSLDDIAEIDPESKHGLEGELANEGRQAGPNSDQAGKPQSPQTGNPRADDRRPN